MEHNFSFNEQLRKKTARAIKIKKIEMLEVDEDEKK